MSDNEHSTASLGDSEVACIEHSPRDAVPEVGQRAQHDAEVPTIVRGEQPGYVLEEQPGGAKSVSESGEFVEEARAGAGEAAPLARDAEVLAGESSAEEVDTSGALFPFPLVVCSVFAMGRSHQRSSTDPSGISVLAGS